MLGSTSLFGGFGTIIGTLLGALSIAVIQNGLILSHISPFYTQIATGTIILLAIWLNTRILNPTRSAAKRIADERFNFSPSLPAAGWR